MPRRFPVGDLAEPRLDAVVVDERRAILQPIVARLVEMELRVEHVVGVEAGMRTLNGVEWEVMCLVTVLDLRPGSGFALGELVCQRVEGVWSRGGRVRCVHATPRKLPLPDCEVLLLDRRSRQLCHGDLQGPSQHRVSPNRVSLARGSRDTCERFYPQRITSPRDRGGGFVPCAEVCFGAPHRGVRWEGNRSMARCVGVHGSNPHQRSTQASRTSWVLRSFAGGGVRDAPGGMPK